MNLNRRTSSRVLLILILVVVAIGLGFLGDHLITLIEKQIYPRDYSAYVEAASEAYSVPEPIIYALIKCESDFNPSAVSSAGAVGLCQIMPDTFLWLTDQVLFEHFEAGMLYDPETNIRYGTYYLSRLYDRYGRWDLALAAYNGGPGNVDKWLEDDSYADGEGGLRRIPFKETRQFVKKVTDAWDMYERLYGKEYAADTES